jgi:hypothetical protein
VIPATFHFFSSGAATIRSDSPLPFAGERTRHVMLYPLPV